MAWSGGNFTRANPTWASDAANGIGIEAGRHDTQDNDFTTGIDQCLNKTGQNGMSGTLSMGSNKITNLAAGTLRNDAAQVGQVQDGTSSYLGTTGGTSTAFTVTATPTITALVTGAQYRFKANAANGVAATLKIDGTTATTMQRQGTALVGNEFIANDIVTVVYDGTNFQITNVATAPLFIDRTNNRVGIGTTAPTAILDVASTSIGTGQNGLAVYNFSNANGATDLPEINLLKSRGTTVGTNTIVQANDYTGIIRFWGANGTSYNQNAFIGAYIDGTPGASNDMPGGVIFGTTANGAGAPIERMRIDSLGNVGIGGISTAYRFYAKGIDTGTGNYTIVLQNSANTMLQSIRNDGLFNTGLAANSPYNITTGAAANMVVDLSGNVLRFSSSLRYKKNVQDLPYGLTDVLNLRPVTYQTYNDNDVTFGGLIAEEVDAIGLSEFVQYNAAGEPDSIHYSNMVSLAFKAIQELNAKVEALEARIAALEA